MSEENDLELKGMAEFLFIAINYVKNVNAVTNKLKKKDWDFILVLEATDWPHAGAIHFIGDELKVFAMSEEDIQDKSKWDLKITSTGPTFFDYFMSRIGVIRPILLGKMKVKGMLKVLKVFWFILTMLKVFKGNQTLSEAFFWQLYDK